MPIFSLCPYLSKEALLAEPWGFLKVIPPSEQQVFSDCPYPIWLLVHKQVDFIARCFYSFSLFDRNAFYLQAIKVQAVHF